jgi:hypothetical protein
VATFQWRNLLRWPARWEHSSCMFVVSNIKFPIGHGFRRTKGCG